MIQVLFVCLGNICRSPMAQCIFYRQVKQAQLSHQLGCDSAGTAAYHIGSLADPRTLEALHKHGIELSHHARQVSPIDAHRFDYLVAMDQTNFEHLKKISSNGKAKILKMRHFDAIALDTDVTDPYYGEQADFEQVYELLTRSIYQFILMLKETHQLDEN